CLVRFFFSSRRRHTRSKRDWSSDVCSSDLLPISVRAGDLEGGMTELRRLALEKGRDPRSISVSVYGAPLDAAGLVRFRDLGVAQIGRASGRERVRVGGGEGGDVYAMEWRL